MIALFTDFGTRGPYLGQVHAVLYERAPGVPVIDLMSDAPALNPRAAAVVLDAVRRPLPRGTVFVCVVDPGVGTALREPVVLEAHGSLFVGPGNGLLDRVAASDPNRRRWLIDPVPSDASPTFHGRDVFAPVAAALALGEPVDRVAVDALPGATESPDMLQEVVYIDGFGNAWTGLEAMALEPRTRLRCAGRVLSRASTFGEVPRGTAMWYENSCGLAEIAVNGASAARELVLRIGAPVEILPEVQR